MRAMDVKGAKALAARLATAKDGIVFA